MSDYVPLGINEEMYEDSQRVRGLLERAGYEEINIPRIQGPDNEYRPSFVIPMSQLPGFRDRDYHPSAMRVQDGDVLELVFRLGAYDSDMYDKDDVERTLEQAISAVGADWATYRFDYNEPHIVNDVSVAPPESVTATRQAIAITDRFVDGVFD
jgi:hypothetical protein